MSLSPALTALHAAEIRRDALERASLDRRAYGRPLTPHVFARMRRRWTTPPSHVLAAVLSTELVGSTGMAADLGERRWRKLVAEHDRLARRTVARHGGSLVARTGDRLIATFAGPSAAVRCGHAICGDVSRLGVQAHVGVHAGEVELRDHGVDGIAMQLAARVMSEASPGETLVSRTVRDLTAGSDLLFRDRGAHPLEGLGERCRLYVLSA